jgi:mannose-6-phosphate isomerase-like protein (cupin superfamily)
MRATFVRVAIHSKRPCCPILTAHQREVVGDRVHLIDELSSVLRQHGSCCGPSDASWRANDKIARSFFGADSRGRTIVDNFVTIRNRHTGEILRLSRVRDAQGQIVLNLDGSLPPRASGPPLHVHFHQREEGKVKSGTLGAQVGKEKIVVPAGGAAVFAAGTRHNWWNAGDDILEFSGQAIPAVDLDRYLQGVFAVVNASPNGRPSIFYIAHVLWRHRNAQLIATPPQAIQRIVFPVILFIGRVLGKYRGSSWPGSPESCPDAPLVEAANV